MGPRVAVVGGPEYMDGKDKENSPGQNIENDVGDLASQKLDVVPMGPMVGG